MTWFVARKLVGMVLTLFVTSFLVFASLYLAPGDPLDFLLQGRSPTPEAVAAVSAQYGLDHPFLVQYWHWLAGVLHLDFGRSLQFREDVGAPDRRPGADHPRPDRSCPAMHDLRVRPRGRDRRRAHGRPRLRPGRARPQHGARGHPVVRRRDHLDLGVRRAARAGSRPSAQARGWPTASTTCSCPRSRCP